MVDLVRAGRDPDELAREFELFCASEESCAAAPAMRLTAIAAEIRTIIDSRK